MHQLPIRGGRPTRLAARGPRRRASAQVRDRRSGDWKGVLAFVAALYVVPVLVLLFYPVLAGLGVIIVLRWWRQLFVASALFACVALVVANPGAPDIQLVAVAMAIYVWRRR